MILHDGKSIPKFPEGWDTGDKDFVWFVWDDFLRGASIAESEWTVPASWTVHSSVNDVSVIDADGITYLHASGALVSTTAIDGSHVITNTVTLSDARSYERSVKIGVKQL